MAQIENVPVPPPLELDPLMLPEPLPDEEDEPDIEPEVEKDDDPLDLLPDDDPLLDEPLLEPDNVLLPLVLTADVEARLGGRRWVHSPPSM
ncbi:MAG: hypothetical protein KF787_00515 [Phycisphaeraceae bacterium]|nr:hypothetical protein [Phycisphaeraceae bacterium]